MWFERYFLSKIGRGRFSIPIHGVLWKGSAVRCYVFALSRKDFYFMLSCFVVDCYIRWVKLVVNRRIQSYESAFVFPSIPPLAHVKLH